ncbi:MAG: hypothetical protein DHS20C09_10270 [marine bacterium B5-7]|jgi:hypothetical protein|nr:MAG: hypothetical protein DHS20C09_10270 [marine bacterium B5-7]
MKDWKCRPDFYGRKEDVSDWTYYAIALLATYSLTWTLFYVLEITAKL